MTVAGLELPARRGPRPTTHPANPHSQLDQQPVEAWVPRLLATTVFAIPDVVAGPSGVSVAGARALVLKEGRPAPAGGFMTGREFAHLHPAPDHSLHVVLTVADAGSVVAAGWGEPHPLAGTVAVPRGLTMVYAPRDAEEVAVVTQIVMAAARPQGPGQPSSSSPSKTPSSSA